ncbi:putative RNA methyltransferase [Paenibacillus humicola]|uniref:putative RNA methyltransferase n=1 Tax=Paenibacillus humicola TaxID=3110540 RepID=UPI00237C0689|nr:methyltransferase domain-containing protein [Paenibacillus humicola]
MSNSFFFGHEGLFRCPICHDAMRLISGKSLICSRRHGFDIARQGYVNFLRRPPKSGYGKSMFESRAAIVRSGFFRPLLERAGSELSLLLQASGERIAILDAGCGEGSHLAFLREELIRKTERGVIGAGLDIAKEGVRIAARQHPDLVWCAADIAECPFQDGCFDAILNILSPSRYAEFQRLLVPGGIALKIVPGNDYLRQLRVKLYGSSFRRTHPGDSAAGLFRTRFELLREERVRYEVKLDPSLREHLFRMTPLSWAAPEEEVQRAMDSVGGEITVDLTMLIGRKR